MKPFVLLLTLLCTALPAYAQEEAPAPIKEGDILPYLERVIAWNRAVSDTELLPDNAREVLLKDRVRQQAKKITQKGFDFARAQAAVLNTVPAAADAPEKTESRRSRLLKAAADADQRVADAQEKLNARGLKANARERLAGALKLAKAQQELIQTMVRISSADSDNSGTLIDQINALSRTVLDDPQDASAASKDDTAAKTVIATRDDTTVHDSDGMFKLCGALFAFSHDKKTLDNLIDQTHALTDANRAMSRSIRAALRSALAEGNALTAGNTKDMAAYHKSLDTLIARYKQLSATVIPLGEMNILLGSAERNLKEWSRLVQDDWARALNQLLLRLSVLCIAVAIPLICSELVRRATHRYVQDSKRQKQLRIVRRVILVTVLAFVILANFISEFGSLATFAGFITAGLAVALQTVLISLVAHFFFFGRYGVRAGDRITVSGVTGDVVQVGMLRLYIRELSDTESGLEPTGKIVAFPNSILFQPTAFYKHMNG